MEKGFHQQPYKYKRDPLIEKVLRKENTPISSKLSCVACLRLSKMFGIIFQLESDFVYIFAEVKLIPAH